MTDACYIDIQRLITLQHRPTGKSYCQWCVAEGLEPTRQYEGYMNIVTHLYDSQGPRGWHSSYERWLREIISELQPTTAGKFKCPIRSCSASRDKIAPLKDHLKTKHASSYVTNLTEEEKWNQVREYFREHHSYELTQSDIDRVYREKENRKARLQKKKMDQVPLPLRPLLHLLLRPLLHLPLRPLLPAHLKERQSPHLPLQDPQPPLQEPLLPLLNPRPQQRVREKEEAPNLLRPAAKRPPKSNPHIAPNT